MGRSYFNDGITGNGRLLVSFTDKGEANRIFWPEQDYVQQINNIFTGIKFDDSDTRFLNENLWYVEQKYEPNTNILVTMYENSDFGLRIYQKDFVVNDQDVWVRNYTIKNICDRELNIKTFLHTDFITENHNVRSGMMDFEDNFAFIYNKEHIVTIGSNRCLAGFQFGDSQEAIRKDSLYGKDEISMTSNMALKWELGRLNPNEEVEFNMFFCFSYNMESGRKMFNEIKSESIKKLIENEKKYWGNVFKKYERLLTGNEKIDEVYLKSILTFKLLTNPDTGAILAGVEVDENYTRCGRYGYCWPRDGFFITRAFDICGMKEEAEKFYTVWAKKVQLPNGAWQQRYFLDGSLAPSWGIQLDEVAAIIYGVFEHYKYCKDIKFLEDMWECIKKAAIYLNDNIDEDSGLPRASYDLWEERIGEHTYTAGAVASALRIAGKIADELKVDVPLAKMWQKTAEGIVKNIESKLWNENEKRFVRGIKTRLNWWNCETEEIETNKMGYKLPVASVDLSVDISLIGLAVPFGIFDTKDDRIKKTVRAIEDRLDGFPSGGFGRYEYDSYIGGNPWIVSTLWLGMYYAEVGDTERAKDLLIWAAKNATNLGFLPEQVDKFTGNRAWISQLSWSCAMFIILLDRLK